MEEQEKQEGQKTVVAFIAGLLIGGLLVWVFSASPEDTATETNTNGNATEQTTTNNNDDASRSTTDQSDTSTGDSTQTSADKGGPNDSASQPEIVSEGNIDVSDQGAGSVVVLDDISYPTSNGWVVVRDYVDGTPGSILGAARYSQEVGLTPASVNLLRATKADNTYQVVFYSENGDRVFDLDDDVEIQGYSATFTAQ